jgi:hypothetical protein
MAGRLYFKRVLGSHRELDSAALSHVGRFAVIKVNLDLFAGNCCVSDCHLDSLVQELPDNGRVVAVPVGSYKEFHAWFD